ncbi:hydantoinase B/oxoprolinase family protein [Haladaptatus pallidirubidus]|uniref:Hydantoinase B/oxoprolinase family protein n=1 Tax=Haladaptatus pallidirubidus TaxID=1008152 RepID=A0AAV3UQQ5_9EURY|nr:hydantoinase B/oxoprolinase family protein [Haladaptatus pallidirubidus]
MNHDANPTELDTQVLWNRLQATAEEMWDTAGRLAFSISIRDWNDTSTAVMTPAGDAVGLSSRSVPVLSGAISRTTRLILKDYFPPETLESGDVIITNDPWIGGGHLSDVVLLKPVFVGDQLVAFAGALGHVGDIGGLMGGWGTDAQQYYEEGLAIPPLKLYNAGEINEAVESFIRGNVRIPDQVIGDIEALRSATMVGANRICELVTDRDIEFFAATTGEILDRSEQAMRNRLADIDDGTYEHELSFSVGDLDVTIQVAATIDDDEIHVDYTGSSEQVTGGINCPYANTHAVTQYIIRCMTEPSTANAEGFFEPISITAQEGSIVNCTRPIATDARHITYTHVEDCLVQALGQAIPEKAVTESAGLQLINFNGEDADGNPFIGVNAPFGPFPARAAKDGMGAVDFPYNGKNVPIEIFEQYVPVRVEENSFVPDTEGAGKFRSALANRMVFRNLLDHEINISVTSNKDDHAPAGFDGGQLGVKATAFSSSSEKDIPTNGRVIMEPGETLTFDTATPGGYGDPRERDRERIERDVRLGFVSLESARETYGYDIDFDV